MTLVGGLVIALCAPLLPVLLGDEWDDAVIVVRLLAFARSSWRRRCTPSTP